MGHREPLHVRSGNSLGQPREGQGETTGAGNRPLPDLDPRNERQKRECASDSAQQA